MSNQVATTKAGRIVGWFLAGVILVVIMWMVALALIWVTRAVL